jgi:hypothetical protein
MALPTAASQRQLKHRRSIDVQVFARGDGLWEVDARLSDIKTRDWPLATGMRPAGTPVHDLLLRLVVDEKLDILEAGAESTWVPYPGHCDAYGDAYARLAGLNLLKGFRQAVKERLGGVPDRPLPRPAQRRSGRAHLLSALVPPPWGGGRRGQALITLITTSSTRF